MQRKRPKSVLIATIVACLIFVLSILLVRSVLMTGDAEVRKMYLNGLKDPLFTGRIALSWICFPALLFKARLRGTHYLTSTLLGLITITFALSATENRSIPPFGNTLPTQIVGWIWACLAGLLFYRFTFGAPSREFFGFDLKRQSQAKGND